MLLNYITNDLNFIVDTVFVSKKFFLILSTDSIHTTKNFKCIPTESCQWWSS